MRLGSMSWPYGWALPTVPSRPAPRPHFAPPPTRQQKELVPRAAVAMYRDSLDEDGLDFLYHGPRTDAERLAYAQRVHPRAYERADPAPQHVQRMIRETGEIDRAGTFLGPNGVLYRRDPDSAEPTAARIRRGFEQIAGRPNPSVHELMPRFFAQRAEAPAEGALPVPSPNPAPPPPPTRRMPDLPFGMASPVPNPTIRNDNTGKGWFGARRESGTHHGIDLNATPGRPVRAPVDGKVVKIGDPYPEGHGLHGKFNTVWIETDTGHRVGMLYVTPHDDNGKRLIGEGEPVAMGTVIGAAQDRGTETPHMDNHVDLRIVGPDGRYVDPTPWFDFWSSTRDARRR